MPKRLGSGEVIRVLEGHGFDFVSQKAATPNTATRPVAAPLFRIRGRNCRPTPPAPSFDKPV